MRGVVQFMESVFEAAGDMRNGAPTEVRIGDSLIMVSEAAGVRAARPAFLYVYVADADRAYERAVRLGAVTVEAPANMPYGDRRATVEDPWGNTWQIATYRP